MNPLQGLERNPGSIRQSPHLLQVGGGHKRGHLLPGLIQRRPGEPPAHEPKSRFPFHKGHRVRHRGADLLPDQGAVLESHLIRGTA